MKLEKKELKKLLREKNEIIVCHFQKNFDDTARFLLESGLVPELKDSGITSIQEVFETVNKKFAGGFFDGYYFGFDPKTLDIGFYPISNIFG